MKRIILNMTSVLLVVIVFLSTAGFNIFSHLCTKSGQKDVSVNKIESCCSTDDSKSGVTIQEESCCQTDQSFVKLSISVPQPKTIAISDIVWNVVAIHSNYELSTCLSFQIPALLVNRPPPINGRDVLIQKQSFLI